MDDKLNREETSASLDIVKQRLDCKRDQYTSPPKFKCNCLGTTQTWTGRIRSLPPSALDEFSVDLFPRDDPPFNGSTFLRYHHTVEIVQDESRCPPNTPAGRIQIHDVRWSRKRTHGGTHPPNASAQSQGDVPAGRIGSTTSSLAWSPPRDESRYLLWILRREKPRVEEEIREESQGPETQPPSHPHTHIHPLSDGLAVLVPTVARYRLSLSFRQGHPLISTDLCCCRR